MENSPFPKAKPKPEDEKSIQRRITKALQNEGFFVKWTHGDRYQMGVPDMYTHHRVYGPRWVECKRPGGSRLEDSQIELFSEWEARRIGVWVLTDATPEKLLAPPNWREFHTGREVKRPRVERLSSSGPERDLQEAIKRKLRATGWSCVDLHGMTYSHGFPDLYACHYDWGGRFIEVKAQVRFTPAQKRVFREMTDVGCPIWVLTSDDVTPLFRKANVDQYSMRLAAPKNPLRP